LLPRRLRDVYRAIWGNQVDWLFSLILRGEDVSLCNLKVKRIRKGLQTAHTGQVNLRLQATLGIDTIVDTGELDFSPEKLYLQALIQCPSTFLNIDGCACAQ